MATPLLRLQRAERVRKRIEKLRYLHRNPVKRGLVVGPGFYQRAEGSRGDNALRCGRSFSPPEERLRSG